MHHKLTGGKADGCDPNDFDPIQLWIGTQVEFEHTNNPLIAQKIAMDHLVENPRYYDLLRKIEPDVPTEEDYYETHLNLLQHNPLAGMTTKGRRMYKHIKEAGTSYAPSAVVYARAKANPGTGLVTSSWAKEHRYPPPTPRNKRK